MTRRMNPLNFIVSANRISTSKAWSVLKLGLCISSALLMCFFSDLSRGDEEPLGD